VERENRAAAGTADPADGIDQGARRSDGIEDAQRQALAEIRLQRDLVRLYGLGPRVVYEFIVEIARDQGILTEDIEERVAAYIARLTPQMLAATGGDRMPPPPVWLVHEVGS
jgi:hypothetical protein